MHCSWLLFFILGLTGGSMLSWGYRTEMPHAAFDCKQDHCRKSVVKPLVRYVKHPRDSGKGQLYGGVAFRTSVELDRGTCAGTLGEYLECMLRLPLRNVPHKYPGWACVARMPACSKPFKVTPSCPRAPGASPADQHPTSTERGFFLNLSPNSFETLSRDFGCNC